MDDGTLPIWIWLWVQQQPAPTGDISLHDLVICGLVAVALNAWLWLAVTRR